MDVYQFTDNYCKDIITLDNNPVNTGKTMVDGIYYNAMSRSIIPMH